MKSIVTISIAILIFGINAGHVSAQTAGTIVTDCDACPEMVVIPSGEFMMGTPFDAREVEISRGEAPQVKIKIPRSFLMARTETTYGMFSQFVRETGYQVIPGCQVREFTTQDRGAVKGDGSWQKPYQPLKPAPNHPVNCVGWDDAQAFIAWLSKKSGKQYRLPTEAEWEYAARGNTSAARFWGDSPNEACAWANTFDSSAALVYTSNSDYAQCDDGFPDVAPVGRFKPNEFGLHDMIGNVWEWVEDCYAGSHQGRPKDGSAWVWPGCENRGVRGGGWQSAPSRSRIAWPGRDPVAKHTNYFGFRVVRNIEPNEFTAPR